MVVFFNDLTTTESAMLNKNLNAFIQKCVGTESHKTVLKSLKL